MKKAIVTGANGFIGHYLVDELVKNNVFVYAVLRKDSNFRWFKDEWTNKVKVINLNLDEYESLSDQINDQVDVFYHLAWQGSAGLDRQNVALQLDNIVYSSNALKAAQKLGSKHFIGAGSIMEIETYKAVYTQLNKPGLAYIYGSAKQACHSMLKAQASSMDIKFNWAMITNAYGENEISPRFINTTLRKIIKEEPLQFTAATQNYDFIYVSDVARAFIKIWESGIPFKHYIIGSNHAKPLKEFIVEIRDKVASHQSLTFGDIPFTGINLSLSDFDSNDLTKDTGFNCEVTFKDGIQKTYDWLRGRQ